MDYLSDPLVASMTLEQEGAYRRLMDVCWLEKGLPTNLDELWRVAKAPNRDRFARSIWNVVGIKFFARRGKLQHRRLDRERAKQAKYNKQNQLAALKRWASVGCERNADALQTQCSSSLSSSSSSSSSSDQIKIKSTAASRRPVENPKQKPADDDEQGTFGLYCVIATEALQASITQDHDDSTGNVAAHFKDLCAQRHLTYDSEIAARAIEASLVADAKRRA